MCRLRRLFACIAVGFVVGFVGASALGYHEARNQRYHAHNQSYQAYNQENNEGSAFLPWPNNSMKSRGTPDALLVGLFIAIPSGVGVALSVTGNNAGGLIGVAISASLLPPMVNAGMCMGIAAWSNDVDVARQGAYSLCLTLVNIGAILVSSFAVRSWHAQCPSAALTRSEPGKVVHIATLWRMVPHYQGVQQLTVCRS